MVFLQECTCSDAFTSVFMKLFFSCALLQIIFFCLFLKLLMQVNKNGNKYQLNISQEHP